MDNRIWHPTNAGNDSRPVIWKLEGNEVLVVAAAIGVSTLVFRYLCNGLHWSVTSSLSLSGAIPLLVLFVVLKLVTGKPPSYAKDFLHWQILKLSARFAGRRAQPLIKPQPNTNL